MRFGLISKLAIATGLNQNSVRKIMLTAPIRYKLFVIPKRNGLPRQIAQPSREVKLLQTALVDLLLANLPVHVSATAYSRGSSISKNAMIHSGEGPIVKMDFKDFFPSIKRSDWVQLCGKTKCLEDPEEIELSSLLLFHKKAGYPTMRLAIGAPSSPVLSNILMFDFDKKLSSFCDQGNILYSRYADDLTFSAPRAGYLHGLPKVVKKHLKDLEFPKIAINEEKTKFVTAKYKRVVTGLVLSNDGRVTIGHEEKRRLRAAVHSASIGKLSREQLLSLGGHIAFAWSVEPDFVLGLRRRYGDEVFDSMKAAAKRIS